MNRARHAVLGNYNHFIILRLDSRDYISVSNIIARAGSPPTIGPVRISPLTIFAALLLKSDITMEPNWIDKEVAKKCISKRDDVVTSEHSKGDKEHQNGSNQGAGSSFQATNSSTSSYPVTHRHYDGESLGPDTIPGTLMDAVGRGVSAPPTSSPACSVDRKIPISSRQVDPPLYTETSAFHRPSDKIPTPPSNISLSTIGDASFIYRSNMLSFHGLERQSLSNVLWESVRCSGGSTPGDSPLTPTFELADSTDPLVVCEDDPELRDPAPVIPLTFSPDKAVLDGFSATHIQTHPSYTEKRRTEVRIVLHSFISHGRIWDAYRATYHDPDLNTTHRVVAKMACMETFARDDADSHHNSTYYSSPDEVEEAIRNEASLYSGKLSSIQHIVVPGFLGLFAGSFDASLGRPEYWLMLMEDGGRDIWSWDILGSKER